MARRAGGAGGGRAVAVGESAAAGGGLWGRGGQCPAGAVDCRGRCQERPAGCGAAGAVGPGGPGLVGADSAPQRTDPARPGGGQDAGGAGADANPGDQPRARGRQGAGAPAPGLCRRGVPRPRPGAGGGRHPARHHRAVGRAGATHRLDSRPGPPAGDAGHDALSGDRAPAAGAGRGAPDGADLRAHAGGPDALPPQPHRGRLSRPTAEAPGLRRSAWVAPMGSGQAASGGPRAVLPGGRAPTAEDEDEQHDRRHDKDFD